MHTFYSDGHVSHSDIASAALRSGIDVVIITDHNVLVNGPEDYYLEGDRRVLLLTGEEIHDQARDPQKNHLLVFGVNRELAPLAYDTQRLIDAVKQSDGLAFIAHPVDPAAPAVSEGDISWVAWQTHGYTGIELWNGMSEFKSLLKSKLHAIFYAYNPKRIARGPFPETIQKWDELLNQGQQVVAIGGSDAHALPARMGPLRRTLFPFDFHFQGINTHIMLKKPLTGDVNIDQSMILAALKSGCAFIGYDLPAATRGFRFIAHGKGYSAQMGAEIAPTHGITFQIRLPQPAKCDLLRNGKVVKSWNGRETCTYITADAGVYRVEAYINYQGQQRAWIFSNPIYVREQK